MSEEPPPTSKEMLMHVVFRICLPFLDKVKRFKQAVVAAELDASKPETPEQPK